MVQVKKFQLRTSEIIQLLGDESFFSSCVSYLFMRDNALAAVEQYHQAVIRKEESCDGCDSKHKDETDYVKGSIATFVRISKELHTLGREHLAPVRQFIESKLGYSPDVIVLYYREAGMSRSLEF